MSMFLGSDENDQLTSIYSDIHVLYIDFTKINISFIHQSVSFRRHKTNNCTRVGSINSIGNSEDCFVNITFLDEDL